MNRRHGLWVLAWGWAFAVVSAAGAEPMHFVGKHEAVLRAPEGEVRASGDFEARTLVAGEMELAFSKLPAIDEANVEPAANHVTVLPLGVLRLNTEEGAFLGRGAVTFLQGQVKRRFQVRMVLRLRDVDGQTVLEGTYEAPGGPGQPPVLTGTLSGKRDAAMEEADLARLEAQQAQREALLARQEEAALRAQLEDERRRRQIEAQQREWERERRIDEFERWRDQRWRDRDWDRGRDHRPDKDRDRDDPPKNQPPKNQPPKEPVPPDGTRIPLTATPPAE